MSKKNNSEILRESWQLSRQHWKLFIVPNILYLATFILGFALPQMGFGQLLAIMFAVLQTFVDLGYLYMVVRLYDREQTSLEHLFACGKFVTPIVICSFFLLVPLGLMLLLTKFALYSVPVFVLLFLYIALRLSLFNLLLVDLWTTEKLNFRQSCQALLKSIGRSWRMSKGQLIRLGIIDAISILVVLLSAIPFGLGLFIGIPFYTFARVTVYKTILAENA